MGRRQAMVMGGFVIALALAAAGDAAGAAAPENIDGYGHFQFGMTVAEAMKAAPRARLMRCAFPNHFKDCVEYDDKAFGQPATVRARFSTDQKLDAVFVQYDRLGSAPGSRACRTAVTTTLARLRGEYGPNWTPKGTTADVLRADAKNATAGKTKPDGKAKPQAKASATAGKPGATKDGQDAAGARDQVPPGLQDLFVWFAVKSGKLGLVDLCQGDDTGVVYVIFAPSSIPGRKAS